MLFRPVIIGEQKLSRFQASWLLLKESWRFLRADSELLLVPVVATIMMAMLFGVLIIGVLVSGVATASANTTMTTPGLIFIAGSYLITAFVVALAQAMVTHTVQQRASGRNATLGQSFAVALRRIPALFVWSLMSATVGVVLRTISERSGRLGRLGSSLLGAGWGVMTYFVVPAIVIDKQSAWAALPHSGRVFKKTWGESIITNISLSLVFLALHLVAILCFFGCFYLSVLYAAPAVFVVAGIVYLVWLFGAISLQHVLNSVVVTLLYLYATADTPPTNFNPELLAAIVTRMGQAAVTPSSAVPLVPPSPESGVVV